MTTYTSIEETLSSTDLFLFIGSLGTVCLLQLLLVYGINRVVENVYATSALVSIFITVNLYSTNLILIEDFMTLNFLWKYIAITAVLTFIKFIIVGSLHSRSLFYAVIALLLMNIVGSLGALALETSHDKVVVNKDLTSTASDKIKVPNLVERPNIYLVGMESAAPSSIINKYMDLREAPLPKAMETLDFRILRNTFSEATAPELLGTLFYLWRLTMRKRLGKN